MFHYAKLVEVIIKLKIFFKYFRANSCQRRLSTSSLKQFEQKSKKDFVPFENKKQKGILFGIYSLFQKKMIIKK
jgi:hypothetical protein